MHFFGGLEVSRTSNAQARAKKALSNKLRQMAAVTAPNVENDDEEEFVVKDTWHLTAHVHGKSFVISAGDATQRIKWLAHVAIARWDENSQQGWRKLGVPTNVKAHRKDGVDMDLGAVIKDVLQNGDTIFVQTSLHPSETII